MKVLLTRPEGRNQPMQQALADAGIPCMITPLMAVEANPAVAQLSPDQVVQADIIIFVSRNAVQFASQALAKPWPTHISYFAVGQATLAAMADVGITGQVAADDNQQSEGLLLLPALQQLQGKQVIIIRGNGGRELLAQTLTERGANVHYWEVYRRCCPPLDGQQISQAWQTFGIDTILLTSPEMLDNLIALVPKELFPWLSACHIIVPSNRAEAQAIAKGMTRVTNAGAAHSKAMLATLKSDHSA